MLNWANISVSSLQAQECAVRHQYDIMNVFKTLFIFPPHQQLGIKKVLKVTRPSIGNRNSVVENPEFLKLNKIVDQLACKTRTLNLF